MSSNCIGQRRMVKFYTSDFYSLNMNLPIGELQEEYMSLLLYPCIHFFSNQIRYSDTMSSCYYILSAHITLFMLSYLDFMLVFIT